MTTDEKWLYENGQRKLQEARVELSRLRTALERIADDADCVDYGECKHVARQALRGDSND